MPAEFVKIEVKCKVRDKLQYYLFIKDDILCVLSHQFR